MNSKTVSRNKMNAHLLTKFDYFITIASKECLDFLSVNEAQCSYYLEHNIHFP